MNTEERARVEEIEQQYVGTDWNVYEVEHAEAVITDLLSLLDRCKSAIQDIDQEGYYNEDKFKQLLADLED